VTALPRLAPLAPTPDGMSISVSVLCSHSPDLADATRHPVTITADWSVLTPHDLEAERVAAAFGGYLSCLELVDLVVPAVRDTVQRHARRVVPRLIRGARGSWRSAPAVAARCCHPVATASAAAEHLRTVEHAAARSGRMEWVASTLLERMLRYHNAARSFALSGRDAALLRRVVQSPTGPTAVWDAGLHPTVVEAIHDAVVGFDGPALPEALYLGVVARRPSLDWLADTVAAGTKGVDPSDPATSTPELAEWLAWTQTAVDRRHRHARADWLRTGVPHSWIEQLSAAGYVPGDVARLSRHTRRSVAGTAHLLLSWVRAGCQPTVEQLVELFDAGVPPWYEPSRPTIHRLRDLLPAAARQFSTTELGLLLARHGTAAAAAAAVRAPDDIGTREECA
jgi:hypothetical protein